MKRSGQAVCLMLGLVLLMLRPGLAASPTAEARDDDPDKTLSPYFFVENGDPEVDRLPLKETRADVRIAGVIADVVVTQVYRNEGTRPISVRYVFPSGRSRRANTSSCSTCPAR